MKTFTNIELNKDLHSSLTAENELDYVLNGDTFDAKCAGTTGFLGNTFGNISCYEPITELLGQISLPNGNFAMLEKGGNIYEFDPNTCTSILLYENLCDFTGEITGVSKYLNGERIIYFFDENTGRYFNLDNPATERNCDDSCDKDCTPVCSLFNPKINIPCVELTPTSGNLPNGVYQVAIAFTNQNTRFSDYYILPQIIRLHSNIGQTHGIELNFEECLLFDYELVLISHTRTGTLIQNIGNYTTQKSHLITELDSEFYSAIDFQVFYSTKTYFQNAGQVAVTNEALVLGDLQFQTPYIYDTSNITSKWKLLSVPKSQAHLYPQPRRDEVYPYDIAWVHCDGSIGPRFHIRPTMNEEYKDVIAPDNMDHPELTQEGCNMESKMYWEVYNTATVENTYDEVCDDCEEKLVAEGLFAYWESTDTYPVGHTRECENISYHKMPDHCKAPLTNGDCVNILAVEFDNITPPVDCRGNPVDVIGYQIYMGEGDDSILSTGLLYNVREEPINCEDSNYFPNYPFNDLNPDKFLGTKKVIEGNIFTNDHEPLDQYSQDCFTYHSPEHQYQQGGIGTEFKIYSEAIGKVSGSFHYTEDYPKYQISSRFANATAALAGVIESNIALNGEKCTKTITEEICERLAGTTQHVIGFPVFVPGTEAGVGGATITTPGKIDQTSEYIITTDPVGECDDTNRYQVESVIPVDCDTNLPVAFDPILDDRVCLLIGTNADPGTSVSVFIGDRTYTGTVVSGGGITGTNSVIIEVDQNAGGEAIDEYLDPSNTESLTKFFPECPCEGNQTTSVTTEDEECTARIDLIKDRGRFEQLALRFYYMSEGYNAVSNFLKSIIKPTNYAAQATFKANYDTFDCTNEEGNCRRLIKDQQYLLPIKQYVGDKRFNNWCNGAADFIKFNSPIKDTVNIDNSRQTFSCIFCEGEEIEEDCTECQTEFMEGTEDKDGNELQAVSYYGGLKRIRPNQYGRLDNYRSRPITCIETGESTCAIGGDIFISQHSFTKKMPFFEKLPLGLPDNTDWDVLDYPNIATPRYWLNNSNESLIENLFELVPILGGPARDFNLENVCDLCKCNPSAVKELEDILNINGIDDILGVLIALIAGVADGNVTIQDIVDDLPTLGLSATILTSLVEWIDQLLNGHVKNPFKEYGIFYTHVTGIACYWGESKYISNYREVSENLPNHYPLESIEEIANATTYHLSEQFLYDPSFLTRCLAKDVTTESTCCPVQDSRIIYSQINDREAINDTWLNFPPLNYQQFSEKDGQLKGIMEIDDYNLFIAFENAAYVTQYEDTLTTDSGDTIYLGSQNAFQRRLRRLATECSGYGGTCSPKSISQSRYGTLWVDDIRKRVLFYTNGMQDITGKMQGWFRENMSKGNIITGFDPCTKNYYITDTENKWTLSLKPEQNFQWISHHSFIPDCYLCSQENMLSQKDGKVWKHNEGDLTTFYGKKYPFIVGMTLNNKLSNEIFQSLMIYADFMKILDYDCKLWKRDETFTDILFYNCDGMKGWEKLIKVNPNKPGKGNISIVRNSVHQFNDFCFDNIDVQPFVCQKGCDLEVAKYKPITTPENIYGDWLKVYLRYTGDCKVLLKTVNAVTTTNRI